MTTNTDREQERPKTVDQIRDAVDELRRRKITHPDLVEAGRTDLWWDDDADVRPDPETDDHWLVDDPATGQTYSTTIIDLWTAHLADQDPDVVISDNVADADAGEYA